MTIKKILNTIFLVSLCKVNALYQGNPASCELPALGLFISEESPVSFKIGYQTEYVFDRKMELVSHPISAYQPVDRVKFFFNQGEFILNVIDRVEAFATLGIMHLSLKRKPFPSMKISAHSNNNFVWSIGGKALVIFWEKTSLGGEVSYLSSRPHLKKVTLNQKEKALDSSYLSYNEWQIQLALSQRMNCCSLYLGGAYSYAKLDFASALFRELASGYPSCETYKNIHKLSMVLGLSVSAKKGFTMNLEAKIFGETSIGGNVDVRF